MAGYIQTFDPDNITKEHMEYLADHIENYIDELNNTMIIPNDIASEHKDQIEEAIKRCRLLIKKLRKGDTSVFKDDDEFNSLL